MLSLAGDQLAELVQQVRAAAQDIALPRFRKLGQADIEVKSAALDPVTEVDRLIEHRLSEYMRVRWPDALVLGEEAAAADPRLEACAAAAPFVIVIDPLDGTWNFAAGTAVFGTLIAFVRNGVPVLGLIYDAVSGTMIVGAAGEGVVEYGSDNTLQALSFLKSGTDLDRIAACFPAQPRSPLPRVARVMSSGASCHDYKLLAQGRLQLKATFTPKPWDHLAGTLIVEELGGRARWSDGRPYGLGSKGDLLVSAACPELWSAFVAAWSDMVVPSGVSQSFSR